MDWQAALRARLLADTTTGALVGTRITWVSRPQTKTLPAITLQTIDDQRPQHLKGFDGMLPCTVQIDCWSAKHAEASTLAEAVLAALIPAVEADGWKWGRGMVDRKADFGEHTEQQFIHRVSMDLTLTRTTA